MQISCSICKEVFIHSSEVVVTECGHLFHSECVFQWLKNQSTCPQCRASVKQKNKVHRVYFDVENDTDVDPSSLQYKIDRLLYDIQIKNGEIKTLGGKVEDLESSNKVLRDIVRKNEEDIQSYRQTNYVLKNEIKNYIKEIENYKQQKMEFDLLKNKVTTLSKVEELINGTVEDVTAMISNMAVNAQSVKQLCTFVQILKQQVKRNDAKKEQVTEEVKLLRRENNKLIRDKGDIQEQVQMLTSANSKLEEDLKHYKELSQKLQKAKDSVDLTSPLPKRGRTMDIDSERENHLSSPLSLSLPRKKSQFSLDTKVINKLDVKKKKLNDFDDLEIIPGPSKTLAAPLSISNDLGIFKKKELVMKKSLSSNFSGGFGSNFVFDGMGGSKKVNLATPTPREEFVAIKESFKKKPTDKLKRTSSFVPNGCKPINSFFRDPS